MNKHTFFLILISFNINFINAEMAALKQLEMPLKVKVAVKERPREEDLIKFTVKEWEDYFTGWDVIFHRSPLQWHKEEQRKIFEEYEYYKYKSFRDYIEKLNSYEDTIVNLGERLEYDAEFNRQLRNIELKRLKEERIELFDFILNPNARQYIRAKSREILEKRNEELVIRKKFERIRSNIELVWSSEINKQTQEDKCIIAYLKAREEFKKDVLTNSKLALQILDAKLPEGFVPPKGTTELYYLKTDKVIIYIDCMGNYWVRSNDDEKVKWLVDLSSSAKKSFGRFTQNGYIKHSNIEKVFSEKNLERYIKPVENSKQTDSEKTQTEDSTQDLKKPTDDNQKPTDQQDGQVEQNDDNDENGDPDQPVVVTDEINTTAIIEDNASSITFYDFKNDCKEQIITKNHYLSVEAEDLLKKIGISSIKLQKFVGTDLQQRLHEKNIEQLNYASKLWNQYKDNDKIREFIELNIKFINLSYILNKQCNLMAVKALSSFCANIFVLSEHIGRNKNILSIDKIIESDDVLSSYADYAAMYLAKAIYYMEKEAYGIKLPSILGNIYNIAKEQKLSANEFVESVGYFLISDAINKATSILNILDSNKISNSSIAKNVIDGQKKLAPLGNIGKKAAMLIGLEGKERIL